MINIKEHIKTLLSGGVTLSVAYKRKINENYGEMKIFRLNDEVIEKMYVVEPGWIKFSDIDEAVNYYCYHALTSKNYGYIQNRLYDKKIIHSESMNFERPSQKLKELFKNEGVLVDAEAKKNRIEEPKPFPLSKVIGKELEEIIKNVDINTFSEKLIAFKRKYSYKDIYLSVNFMYDYYHDQSAEPVITDYSYGCELNNFNAKELNKAKKRKGSSDFKLKYKQTRFVCNINRNHTTDSYSLVIDDLKL